MRLLHVLAHLVLALAFMTATVAQARVVGVVPVVALQHHAHDATSVHTSHAGHDHAARKTEHPSHERDACQTACCFAPAQLPAQAAEAGIVEASHAVRYLDVARALSSRASAPDPGVPKHAA